VRRPADVFGSGLLFVRYLANGTPDRSFGDEGQVVVGPGGWVSALAAQSDGKIIAAAEWGILRLDRSGRLDPSFTSGGIASGVVDGPSSPSPLGPTARRSWGSRPAASGATCGLARLGPDGTPDCTFGVNGVATVGSGHDNLAAIAVDGVGRLVGAGSMTTIHSTVRAIGLTRHLANGELDATFGDGGKELTYLPGFASSGAVDLVLQSDGKPVVAA
jgi:uncharacterized delta-60 repeat protein